MLGSNGTKCGAPHFVQNPEYVKIQSTFSEQALGEDLMKVYSRLGERQKVGGQAALRFGSRVCGCGLNLGYQRRNRSSRSSLSPFVLVCSKKCCFNHLSRLLDRPTPDFLALS